MCKKIICSILLFSSSLCAQSEIARLSQLNRIFFITEINGLTANIVNPAGLSIKQGDDGFLFGYDFVETNIQGNSFVSLSMGNLGSPIRTFIVIIALGCKIMLSIFLWWRVFSNRNIEYNS